MYTFEYTYDQLHRAEQYLRKQGHLRVFYYVLYDEQLDYYIALIDCNERDAVMLALLQ